MGDETIYAIRRADGNPIYNEFSFLIATDRDDWEAAFLDSEYAETATEYEMVRMTVEVVEQRTYPLCADSGCDTPAEHWGLCEPHAREDDPETLDEILTAREAQHERA